MKALVLDTETTGLIDNGTRRKDLQPSVIEFYGCRVDLETGEVEEELEFLCKPPNALEKKISKITGLTDEDLADKPPFSAVSEKTIDLIERSPIVIAHNASFDTEMLDLEVARLGTKILWPRIICTVEATVGLKGHRLSLSLLHDYLFGETFEGSHRARADVEALVRCCVELRKRDLI